MSKSKKQRVSKAEREAVQEYVNALARELRLADWAVRVLDESAEPNAYGHESAADVTSVYGRKRANLRLGPSWHELSEQEKRHTLTHELIHLHAEGMDDVIYYNVRPVLAPAVWDVLKEEFRRSLEFCVDGLADAIAPHMPLPGEAEQRKGKA